MKKLLVLLLSLSFLLCTFAGCGEEPTTPPAADDGTEPQPDENPDNTTDQNPDQNTDTTPPDTTTPNLPDDAINAVTAWGITEEAGAGITNGVTLYQKLSLLANGATVYFPEGTYEIDLPLSFVNKKNIRIVGDNATFLNTRATNIAAAQSASTSPSIPLTLRPSTATSGMVWIEGCENITVEGITFRYAAPTSISGKVVSKTSTTVDIRVTDGSLITGEEYVMAINTFDADGVPDRRLEQYAATNFPVTKVNDTTLRISGVNVSALPVNVRVCLRTSLSSNYVFTIFNSSDLIFRDLTLTNSFNGGFLIEHRTVNATFERVNLAPLNENTLMSLNADALHITGLGGKLIIRDCDFTRGGDDFLNVSGAAGKIKEISGTTLAVTLSWGADTRWARVGDTIAFYDPATLALLGTSVVTRANGLDLTFDSLPAGVTTSTVLSNKTLHPTVEIEDCTFTYNRARALLIQTDNVSITRCDFYGTTLAAILVAPDFGTFANSGNSWMEVSPAQGVTISDCRFESCGDEAEGAIIFAVDHDNLTLTVPTPIHSDITIEGCVFKTEKPALYAVSCGNLTLSDNHYEEVTAEHAVILRACDGVTYPAADSNLTLAQNTTNITAQN